MDRWVRAGGMFTLALAIVSSARAQTTAPDAPTAAELMRQIQSLQAQVQTLQEKQSTDEAARAKEQDVIVDRVLADAKTRSEIMPGGATAGWDKGQFYVASADRNFYMHPWLQSQFRYATAYRDGGKTNGADDTQSGFEVRRLRFGVDGNLFTPNLTYLFNFGTYRAATAGTLPNGGGTLGLGNGGAPELEEAWLKYHFAETPWSVVAGQIHDPLDHESMIGSKYRGAEASYTTDIFANTENYVQGVEVVYEPTNDWRIYGAFTDGIRSNDTNFVDFPTNGTGYDFGFAGRVEYKVMGDWSDYNQLTALGDKHDLLVVGGGFDVSQGGDTTELSHTIDVDYANTNGVSVYGAYFGRYTTNNRGIPLNTATGASFNPGAGDLGADTYEYSVMAQAAYLLPNKIEPYVRYEYLHLAGTPAGSNNGVHALSAGANYYLYGHNAKLTGQISYLPNGIPINDDSEDTLLSNNKGEVVFLLQFQLML